MRMGWLGVIVNVLLSLGAASACVRAAGIAPAPIERASPPRIAIAEPLEAGVAVESVKIRTEINGRLAQTEVELLFRNPNARVLEGELQFPLLAGQSVTGFALDVNGALRDAVPVDKARGQAIFEEIVRGSIDPGLLQATAGNNFKLRIYPIPARGTRQVVIRYSEALAERGERLVYRLPLEYAERLESFLLDLRVAAPGSQPIARPSALGAFEIVGEGRFFTARVARSGFAGRGALEIELARAPRQSQVYTQSIGGRTWFYAEVPVAAAEAPRKPPRTVGIVWDSSGSGASRDHARELALLDAYFKRMGSGEVRLLRIRDAAEPVQTFRFAGGDWRALRAALESTPYDGATDLGAFAAERGVDEYLLFSDGLSNFGERSFVQPGVPVHTIATSLRSNPVWLRHVAEASGGRHVDLAREDARSALLKLATRSTRVERVAADGAAQVVLASPFPERGSIALAGELTRPAATIRITLAQPNAGAVVVPVAIDARAGAGGLAAALWARLKLAELEADYGRNRAEIRELGRRFGLVTRETSLIVLERIEDYARHEIAPPPELAAAYRQVRATFAARRAAERTRHLAEVVRRFEDKVAWWEREFPKDERIALRPDATPRAAGALADAPLRQAERARREQSAARADAARQVAPSAPAAEAPALSSAQRDARQSAADGERSAAAIRLAPWQPQAPYLEKLRKAAPGDVYRAYLDERVQHPASTAFFLDAADVLLEKQQTALAVRVLSNLAEMDLENRHILRILGYRLLQAGRPALAVAVLRKVLELSPDEPQSYRDLGLALAAEGRRQEAIDTLYEVVVRPWHNRFPEIELITLAELNAIVATAPSALDTSRVHPQLLRNLPLDLRVVLAWDADNTDIDLWVTDPNGEKAYYGNRLTYQGGRMSLDFTGGYGPEEFSLKRAKPGRYRVEAQYFGDRRQAIAGPTTLMVKLATKFGRPEQQERLVTLRLAGRSETLLVGEFEVEAGAGN